MNDKTKKMENLPEMLTLRQDANVLNCHENTLRNRDNKGVLVASASARAKTDATGKKKF